MSQEPSKLSRHALTVCMGLLLASSFTACANTTSSPLSNAEIKGLQQMVEEEKLAGDVYQTLYEQTGLQNFSHIMNAERRHQAAVQNLLQQYGQTDPTSGKNLGDFSKTELRDLYKTLVAKGMQSNADALKVGLKIEDLDIYDLEKQIAQTNQADIKRVYENLTRGSRNHMRAFHRNLTGAGDSYKPEFISETQFNAIIQSDQERGNGGGMGHGMGN